MQTIGRRWPNWLWRCTAVCACVIVTSQHLEAADPQPSDVLVQVGDEKITRGEFDASMIAATQGRPLPSGAENEVTARMLDALVRQRLLEGRARREMGASDLEKQLDAQIDALRSQAKGAGTPWNQWLSVKGLTEASLRRQLAINQLVQRLGKTRLSDEAIEKYFQQNRQHWDGSQVRVSHILLRSLGFLDDAAYGMLVQRGERLREMIESGRITFQQAVERYSAGPSRRRGGDLGFVPADGSWEPSIVAAVQELKPQAVSPPVKSSLGVHLLKVTEVQARTKTLADVRSQVLERMSQEMLVEVIREELRRVRVKFTPGVAHLDLETGAYLVDSPAEPSPP